MHLAVEALGADAEGRDFSALARTVEIHRDGAVLLLPPEVGRLVAGQTITLRRPGSEGGTTVALVRVLVRTGMLEGSPLYAVRLLDVEEGFWAIEFPETADFGRAVACMLLECCFCRRREVTYVNEREMLCFNAQRGVARICVACNMPTIWVQTLDDDADGVAASKTAAPAASLAAAERLGQPTQVHHKQVAPRFRTRLTAVVRATGGEEELAVCENMSRGGLCFRTRRAYTQDSILEVSVPYTKGAANIFVPARVVYVQEMPTAGLFRHGAAYIRMAGETEELLPQGRLRRTEP
jgi:hypothetical protein